MRSRPRSSRYSDRNAREPAARPSARPPASVAGRDLRRRAGGIPPLMRTIDHIAILTLAALLTWLLFMGLGSVDPHLEAAVGNLDTFAVRQTALRANVLSARAGTLQTYDPMVAQIQNMRDQVQALRGNVRQAANRRLVDRLAQSLQEQESLVEQFKSRNALLQNSLAYLGMFSARLANQQSNGALHQATDGVADAIMRLTLDTSPPVVFDARAKVAVLAAHCRAIACPRDADALLAHGRLLNNLLPEIDGIVARLLDRKHEMAGASLAHSLHERRYLAERNARRFRVLLYLASLLLLYFLGRWGMRLRAKSRALHLQMSLEHAVASLSAGLIGTTPESLPQAIRTGLRTLCEAVGATEALFCSDRDGQLWSSHHKGAASSSPFAGEIVRLAPASGAAGSGWICVRLSDPRVPASLRQARAFENARSFICLLTPGSTRENLLVFAFEAQDDPVRPELVPVLHTAFDTLSLAIDHQHAAHERDAMERQVRHARRMQAVGAFTSGVAHNFNNLIGAITGNAEMAQAKLRRLGASTSHADQILIAAERGRSLVDNLLAYGRRPELRRRLVDLDELAAEAGGLAAAGLPDHRIELRTATEGATLTIDPVQMQQVVLNLCNNAAQAMPPGGTVRLATRIERLHAPLQHPHATLPPGRYLQLSVRDTGRGMNPAVLKRAFEPFYTTRPTGTGLGLATAREIVRAAGGEILIDSRPAMGTQVQIWLPHREADAVHAPAPGPEGNATDLRGSGETILYLARSEEARLSGEELLAALGYEPVGFTSADQLLAACRRQPDRFEALLLEQGDACMEAVLTDIGALPMPRILATAALDDIDFSLSARAGIVAVIRAPLDPVELLKELHRCLRLQGVA